MASAESDKTSVEFRLLFEASPDVLLVLLPDAPRYTMVAATDARIVAWVAAGLSNGRTEALRGHERGRPQVWRRSTRQ